MTEELTEEQTLYRSFASGEVHRDRTASHHDLSPQGDDMGTDLEEAIKRAAKYLTTDDVEKGILTLDIEAIPFGGGFYIYVQEDSGVEHEDLGNALALALDTAIDILERSSTKELPEPSEE